jgi:hypothetical protein
MNGGDIGRVSGLKHILSIGYEVECGILTKLTRTEVGNNPDEIILYNSDTARKEIKLLKDATNNLENIHDSIITRLEETMEDVIFDKNGKVDKHSIFNITNDIAMSPFIKKLGRVCQYSSDDNSLTNITVEEQEAQDLERLAEKNDMYLFRDSAGQDYKINFIFGESRHCNTHSNVEWVFTYLKPNRSNNIIMDTFVNMITNLVRHLDELQPIHGNYIIKYKNIDDTIDELVIDKPDDRILYHKPNSNLYYLQTQISDSPMTIDDACSVVQMTFASKAEHSMNIIIALFTDTTHSIEKYSTDTLYILTILLRIKSCVDNLFEDYNNRTTKYKMPSDTAWNKTFVESIKSYIFLILFKIGQYAVFKTSETQSKYFKNVLFVNSRHSNYVLYTHIKSKIKRHFGIDSAKTIAIIKDLIFVPEILKQFVSPDVKLRRGIFSISNTLDKTNKNYGDPLYSLISYFDFFEAPIDNEQNTNAGNFIYYDWLEYKNIDNVSNKMELNNDIVLIECRNFQRLLSLHVYNMADEELKQQMKTGACNILTKHIGEDVSSMSVANFKKIIELYNKSRLVSNTQTTTKGTATNTKTRSTKTRSKTQQFSPRKSRRKTKN